MRQIVNICILLLLTTHPLLAAKKQPHGTISSEAFTNPPMEARPGALWCWLNGTVDHEQMSREMEEAKALGMRGFEIWDIGVYKPQNIVPAGPAFLGKNP